MSNHFAIATVTNVIGQLVLDALKDVVANLDHSFERPAAPSNKAPRVHIYLYGVSADAAKRNADLPTRGPEGKLAQRPRAALNLHYLLTFYGDDATLEPQRMLAAVVRDIHAMPVLTRKRVRTVIGAQNSPVADSDLDEAVEQVRLDPRSLSLEDMSRLWSVMVQTPYALSIACDAAVVLLDALETAPAALPALRRGDEDRGPEAQAALLPRIDSLWIGLPGAADLSPRPPSLPSAQLGAELIVAGANLGGDAIHFEFKHPLLEPVPVDPAAAGPDAFRLALPDTDPTADWAAGLYAVTAVVTRNGKTQRSALWPMALAPRIDTIAPDEINKNGGAVLVLVDCRPQVLKDQSALALLSTLEVPAAARATAVSQLSFAIDPAPLALGPHRFFLRIDGADSQPFVLNPGGGFAFDDQQRVTVTA